MRYGSGCSGIEAFSVAVEELGWEPAYFAEIEKFPSAVLKHRWPSVPNLGDFTAVDGAAHPVDVLVAGTPCQSFSFAGLRKSLEDVRGNIMFAFIRLAHATPALRYAVWENVPGVLSTDDNAFGCLLAGLVGADGPVVPGDRKWGPRVHFDDQSYDVHRTYGWEYCRWPDAGMVAGPLGRAAWRVLDAQYFRLAQRRRRVFVVFCPAGSGGDPAAILFERQGLHRHPPSRGEAGQRPAGTLAARTQGGGGLGTDFDLDGGLVPVHQDVAHTLRGEGFDASEDGTGRGTPLVPVAVPQARPAEIASTLNAAFGDKLGLEDQHINGGAPLFVPGPGFPVAFTAQDYGADARVDLSPTSRSGNHDASHANAGVMPAIAFALRGRDEGNVPEVEGGGGGGTAGTLRAASGGSTPPHVAYSIMPQNSGKDYKAREVEVAQPLMAGGPTGGNQGGDYVVDVVPINQDAMRGEGVALTPSKDAAGRIRLRDPGFGVGQPGDPAGTITTGGPGGVATQYAVRRLTPTECARLQGFPDDHARIPWGKGETPDGPMYKAYGNSMAVPCMRWIAARIDAQVKGLPMPGLTEVLAMTDPDAPAAQEG